MREKDHRPYNAKAKDDGGIVLESADEGGSGYNYSDDHVPAPAGHAPRIEHTQIDSTTHRVEEPKNEGAWVEFEPTGVC